MAIIRGKNEALVNAGVDGKRKALFLQVG